MLFIICSVLAFPPDLEQGAWYILTFWIILIFKTSILFKRMNSFGYSKCYVLTLWSYTQKNPKPKPTSPFPNRKRSNHFNDFFYDYFCLPWRAIFQEKKLVFSLVHQVNGNHRAPLPSVIHPASLPKAITLFFQLSVHSKRLPLLPVFFHFFLAFNIGSNGLLLMSKRWTQLKIFPTCTAKEDLIKKTMLYTNSKLTFLSTCKIAF